MVTKHVDELGIEMAAGAFCGDAASRVDAAAAVVDLGDVGERHDPHRKRDALALDVVGDALAVPPLVGLAERIRQHARQPEARGKVRLQPSVGVQELAYLLEPRGRERRDPSRAARDPPRRRRACATRSRDRRTTPGRPRRPWP